MADLGSGLAMLKFVCDRAKDEDLNLGNRLFPGGAIGHGSGQSRNFGKPATIVLLFDFNAHGLKIANPTLLCKWGSSVRRPGSTPPTVDAILWVKVLATPGFGAEIEISTSKIHARGPMGLEELISHKNVLIGDGATRGQGLAARQDVTSSAVPPHPVQSAMLKGWAKARDCEITA
jgi:hypothetical protein